MAPMRTLHGASLQHYHLFIHESMKAYILSFLLIMTAFFNLSGATPKFTTPDFAYPQKVIASAQKNLDAGLDPLRCLLEITTAERAINPDTIFTLPSLVNGYVAKAKTDADRAMLTAFEAELYASIYQDNMWRYNRVDAPLLPLPDDIAKWSAAQFAYKLNELYTEALRLAKADNKPLADYKNDVEYGKETLDYIPDIYSFILYRKVENLSEFNEKFYDRTKLQTACDEGAAMYAAGSPEAIYWQCTKIRRAPGYRHYDEYLDLYKANIGKPGAPYALAQAMNENYESFEPEANATADERNEQIAKRDSMIALLKQAIAKYPTFYQKAIFENKLKAFTNPTMAYNMPNMTHPGGEIEVKVRYAFTKSVGFGLYKLTDGIKTNMAQRMVSLLPCIEKKSVPTTAIDGEETIKFQITEPGRYAIVPMLNGKVQPNADVEQFLCVPFLPVNINGCTTNAIFTADYISGAPVADIMVNYIYGSVKAKVKSKNLGKTDKHGMLAYTAPDASYYRDNHLQFNYRNKIYKFNQNINPNKFTKPEDKEPKYRVEVLTDRTLYHPGDSVSWAIAIAVKEPGKKPVVVPGQKATVYFLNANNQKVDTCYVTTDALGRANGVFATQKGTLTGIHNIEVRVEGSSCGWDNIMVSDFKLPTFEAEFTSVERDVPTPGAVRLTGKARTYSGMPLVGANVKVTVKGASRWRWFAPEGQDLVSTEVATDASGVFTVDIPAEDLDKKNFEGEKFQNFIVSAVVTSATAETSECTKNFTTGKPYVIAADPVTKVLDTSKPLSVKFQALNADDENKPIAINWQLLNDVDETVLSGDAKGGELKQIDVSSLGAGTYTLSLAPADAALADIVAEAADVTLFNIKRNQVPGYETLFVPQTRFTLAGNKAEVYVGTAKKEIYVYAAMQLGDELITLEPRKLGKGFDRFKLEVPANYDEAKVSLFTVYEGEVKSVQLTLTRPQEGAPEIVAESFRDRLVPGASETWHLRLIDGNGNGMPDAAMVATMYNKALDQLRNGTFATSFRFYQKKAQMSLDYAIRRLIRDSNSLEFTRSNVPGYTWPVYMFWDGRSYYNSLRIRGARPMMKSLATEKVEDLSVSDDVEYEAAADGVRIENEVVAEPKLYGAAAGVEVEEVAVATVASEAQEDAGQPQQPDKFEYRLSEVLQAFWKPALVTDADGNVDIVFTVPNANTTWQFKAAAWTADLKTAKMVAEAMANKPVMVQPNLPRFMRQGDTATILATVFNNSADTATVATTVELFDVATGKTVESREFSNVIAPDASAVVAMPVTAAGTFADGEQAAIPVLSAASTVVESTEFYLNPDDKEPFTLTVKASKDASVTLQYCQNPVWTVVKAMRGIAGRNETTSTGLVGRLFSALAARHILKENPSIADAIKQWSENPSEEALVSMLEKNEDLKRLMLDQTPWVQAAANNSQRMAALADLLDPAKADAAINATTTALAKLQNADGGFQWGGWSKQSSEWTTRTVLTTLGIAYSLNMLSDADAAITKMLQPAYTYVEKEAVKPNRAKTDSELALIATYFPTIKKSVAGDRLIRNTVGEVARTWRTDGTVGKAYDVLILAGNGRRNEAANVLASIREFGVVKPGMGLCFPSVNDIRGYATIIQAYAAMKAPATEIDAMRQWVIVQAQANDDLGAYNPDYVIAAVLLTGSNWTYVPVSQNVTVNGKSLAIGKVESATGYFAQRLEGSGKFKITVKPNGVTPSYGSVVTIDRRPMASVEARPGRDLSIDKRVLVERDGEWVETNDFTLGERVRVQLTLVAKRNLEYVSIDDERPACFEPVEQLPGYVWGGGLGFYRENLDASTRLFIGYLPQGTYHLTYDMTASLAGSFISGIATLQSQYAPELTAHSGAARIEVK